MRHPKSSHCPLKPHWNGVRHRSHTENTGSPNFGRRSPGDQVTAPPSAGSVTRWKFHPRCAHFELARLEPGLSGTHVARDLSHWQQEVAHSARNSSGSRCLFSQHNIGSQRWAARKRWGSPQTGEQSPEARSFRNLHRGLTGLSERFMGSRVTTGAQRLPQGLCNFVEGPKLSSSLRGWQATGAGVHFGGLQPPTSESSVLASREHMVS